MSDVNPQENPVQSRVEIIPQSHGGALVRMTPERGRELARRRHDTAARAARKALAEAAGVDGWAAGWYEVVKAQSTLALSGTRGSTPAARFVGVAGDILKPGRDGADGAPGVDTLRVELSGPGVAERLAALLARREASE